MHSRNNTRSVCSKRVCFQWLAVLVIVCILGSCSVFFSDNSNSVHEPLPMAAQQLQSGEKTRGRVMGVYTNNNRNKVHAQVSKQGKVLVNRKVKTRIIPKIKKKPMVSLKHNDNSKSKKGRTLTKIAAKTRCPDVLKMAAIGKWQPRKLSRNEQKHMDRFLNKARKQLNIVPEISRKDGKCGNVSLPYKIARALCDPRGKTPCCIANRCTALPVDKCMCDDCYDMRQRIYAEYATWIPSDKRCRLKNFTAMEACNVLSGTELYLVGDSYMRNLYSAFLTLLRNDGLYGALKPSVPRELKRRCGGVYALGSKECRPLRDSKPGPLCNGTFKMAFVSHSKSKMAPQFLQLIGGILRRKGVVVLAGLGSHENYSSSSIQNYLKDALSLLKVSNVQWPKLVWANNHAPGLLKSLRHKLQDYRHVNLFNQQMVTFLKPYNIPVFDTFAMTKDILSFDGSHYGLGVCLTKAKLYLNYLQDMKSRGHWGV